MNEMSLASNQKRVASFVIDDIVIVLLLLAIFYDQLMQIASGIPTNVTPESVEVFKAQMNQFSVDNLLFILLLKVLYHTFFVWQNGMTLGKYIMKIKVVEAETSTHPLLHKAFLRASLRIVSEAFFYLGFLLAFFTPLRQTLHDKLSNCVVVDV
jgi:uncharacterized RDD family membrane protein YckC